MIEKLTKAEKKGKKVICFKNSIDTRNEGSCIKDHGGKYRFNAIQTKFLMNEIEEAKKHDYIGIDEGQFFESEDIINFVVFMKKEGKFIYVTGLNGDFKQHPFITISNLIPFCDKIKKKTALCGKCQKKASFTLKKSPDDQVIDVGGNDKYEPVCFNCFY